MLDPRLTRPTGRNEIARASEAAANFTPNIQAYSVSVPFDIACTIVHATLDSNDTFVPNTLNPMPGGGAIYRLVGDGTHWPTFDDSFVKGGASGDFDNTAGVVNLITFLFDGIDYWYTITQPAT